MLNPRDGAPPAAVWRPVRGGRGPRLNELNLRQIECVLARNHLGRVAFVDQGRVELFPVHYVYADQVLYGRTASGTKYRSWQTHADVVLEVDESAGLFEWRSVIVRGTISILRPQGPRAEPFAYWNAVAAIRTLIPAAFTERDPMPYRHAVFRVAPVQWSGRQALPT